MKTKVTVEIAGRPTWERSHDEAGNPGGITTGSADHLKEVSAVLREAVEQAENQFSVG